MVLFLHPNFMISNRECKFFSKYLFKFVFDRVYYFNAEFNLILRQLPKLSVLLRYACDIMKQYSHMGSCIRFRHLQFYKKLTTLINLPSDWDLDEVLLLTMPRKDGWGGLADDPRVMEVVVAR